jgi:hypothetical protein
VSNSGILASNKQNTTSPKYNYDILISQYLIPGTGYIFVNLVVTLSLTWQKQAELRSVHDYVYGAPLLTSVDLGEADAIITINQNLCVSKGLYVVFGNCKLALGLLYISA